MLLDEDIPGVFVFLRSSVSATGDFHLGVFHCEFVVDIGWQSVGVSEVTKSITKHLLEFSVEVAKFIFVGKKRNLCFHRETELLRSCLGGTSIEICRLLQCQKGRSLP